MRYFHKLLISTLCIITIGISQTNYSLSFDGVDDYVAVSHNIAGSYTGFTISAWVKIDTYGDNNTDFILDVGRNEDAKRMGVGS